MTRKLDEAIGKRRLLSLWEPPQAAGEPVGVIATTFTLDTALFEEECLARFCGVQSDPARDGALYRIEREERFANIQACVIADVHHCAGTRSLRWDLLAARPQRGVMHAKVSLLAWRDHLRVLVGSANLSESGHRRNQETATAFDFTVANTDQVLLAELLTFLRELLALTDGPGRGRALSLLDWTQKNFSRQANAKSRIARHFVFTGPKRESLFDQLKNLWPGGPIDEAHVVSPFFDKELRETGPEIALWRLLRQRGPANVHFHVEGEQAVEDGNWRLAAPAHLISAQPKGRWTLETHLRPINAKRLATDNGIEDRPLHAKSIVLSDEAWILVCMGSSNFTSAGTGSNPSAMKNVEANAVYILRAQPGEPLRQALMARVINGGMAVKQLESVEWTPAFDGEDEVDDADLPLPEFFALATIAADAQGRPELRLSLRGQPPVGAWLIRNSQALLLDSAEWDQRGRPDLYARPCADNEPLPGSVLVEWGDSHGAEWPVNVELASVLPAPPELKGLSLQALLELLASGRPLHEALRAWMRKSADDDEADVAAAQEIVDPHDKVDVSGFLIKRTQRACAALHNLRKRMEEPALSETAMAWRLEGPVGARAVLEAIRRQCDPLLPDEWGFLLGEAVRELSGARLVSSQGAEVSTPLRVMHDSFVAGLKAQLPEAIQACSSPMQQFLSTLDVSEAHAAA